MDKQRGMAHILLILLLLAAIVAGVYLVGTKTNLFPKAFLPKTQQVPKIELKSEYKNPFNKETQYVNPFETYKNPFEVAK